MIFFCLAMVSASSNMLSSWLTHRIWAVPTIIVSHFPCSLAAGLFPLQNNLWVALAFLIIRHGTMDMNQVPRQAFIAAALLVR